MDSAAVAAGEEHHEASVKRALFTSHRNIGTVSLHIEMSVSVEYWSSSDVVSGRRCIIERAHSPYKSVQTGVLVILYGPCRRERHRRPSSPAIVYNYTINYSQLSLRLAFPLSGQRALLVFSTSARVETHCSWWRIAPAVLPGSGNYRNWSHTMSSGGRACIPDRHGRPGRGNYPDRRSVPIHVYRNSNDGYSSGHLL